MPEEEARIIVIYGFLGSGKTTVMLHLAKCITASGKRAAIVVNEAGKVPVDGKLLSMAGLPVKEIFAGCVCCSVVGDFVATLAALGGSGEFSCILVEPSGMADAPRLFESLLRHGSFPLRKILILDGVRLALLMKVARPLMEGQMREADIILLNKNDAGGGKDEAGTHALIEQCAHHAPVYPVSALLGIPDDLIKEIFNGILDVFGKVESE
ncbi:MAG: GTP-binding protein [Thermodesulfovibrionales bacterium]